MQYIKGDITNETTGLIIHGVNCQRAMGSGVAKFIKTKWPIVYDEYMKIPKGRYSLGTMQIVPISKKLFVGNCWTQEFYGNDGKVYADELAVFHCLLSAFAYCSLHELELKSPKIASGLAGLDWDNLVVHLFSAAAKVFPDVKVKIFIFD